MSLPFGLKPSPALLNAEKHLTQYEESEPSMFRLLSFSFYVDDFIGGAASIQEAEEIYSKARQALKEGGFNLRKWHTNEQSQQKSMVSDTKGSQNQVSLYVKVLGLNWDCKRDQLCFELSEILNYLHQLPATKRSFLKLSARIFDPLRFLSPFTVQLKFIFQHLCVAKVNWDDHLEGPVFVDWNKLGSELEALTGICVCTQYIDPSRQPVTCQLHGFCDASTHAYAAIVYLRFFYTDGTVEVKFFASKTRFAPIKGQTIPRLELLGALILARLMNSVYLAMKSLLNDVGIFYWTDSYTALCWIRNSKQWKQYVMHRVTEIRELPSVSNWRFCPGKENPADIPSRGCKGSELVNNSKW